MKITKSISGKITIDGEGATLLLPKATVVAIEYNGFKLGKEPFVTNFTFDYLGIESPATPSVGREALIKLLQEAKKGCLITSGLTGNIYWKFDNDSETKLANDFLASHPASKPVEVTDEMIKEQARTYARTYINGMVEMRSQMTANKREELLKFLIWYSEKIYNSITDGTPEEVVDNYLTSLNQKEEK